MPYRLSTPSNPFDGTFHVLSYEYHPKQTAEASAAYKIIACFASIEFYQKRVFLDILGGADTLAAAVFGASVSRHQKSQAILAAARVSLATDLVALSRFEQIMEWTGPAEKLRDRLAHWIPAEVFPPIKDALIILNPRDITDPKQALAPGVSPLVYTLEELELDVYGFMRDLVNTWAALSGFLNAPHGKQRIYAEKHLNVSIGHSPNGARLL